MPWFDNMGWRRKAGGEKWTIKTIKNEKWTIKTIVKWTVLLISPSQSQCHLLLERSFPPLSLPSWWTAWHCRPLILCFQSSHSEQGTGTTDKPKFSLTDSLTLFDAFLFSQTCLKFYRIEATLRWCPQGCVSLRTKCQRLLQNSSLSAPQRLLMVLSQEWTWKSSHGHWEGHRSMVCLGIRGWAHKQRALLCANPRDQAWPGPDPWHVGSSCLFGSNWNRWLLENQNLSIHHYFITSRSQGAVLRVRVLILPLPFFNLEMKVEIILVRRSYKRGSLFEDLWGTSGKMSTKAHPDRGQDIFKGFRKLAELIKSTN